MCMVLFQERLCLIVAHRLQLHKDEPFDFCCQLPHGGSVEERPQGKMDAEYLVHLSSQLHSGQGIAPDQEKVLINANLFHP